MVNCGRVEELDISHARLKDVARYYFQLFLFYIFSNNFEPHRELVGEAVSNVVSVKLCSVQVLFVLNILVIESNQGLHLPNLVEKVCQKGSRLRHLHLEELNQPPDNTSLHEEDPFVCLFLKSHIQVFCQGPG